MKMTKVFTSVVVSCLLVATCRGGENGRNGIVVIDAPPAVEDDRRQPLHDIGRSASRSKRGTPSCGTATLMTAAQQTESLNVHNLYRGQEPAGDQLQMSWNDNLAAQAQAWAQQCQWQHGMLTDCAGNVIGQNLYMIGNGTTYPTVNLTNAITSWKSERQNWDFTSGSCLPNQICGHWTQVVWSRSNQVGCGYAQCPAVTIASTGAIFYNAVIIACDYSPAGNYVNQPVYAPGAPCSACASVTRLSTTNRGYKCINNLCVPCSPDPVNDPTCQCGTPYTCNNGGTWTDANCSCICAAGYYGSTCQTKCADVSSSTSCNSWFGLGYCSTASIYYGFMKQNCAYTCSLCF